MLYILMLLLEVAFASVLVLDKVECSPFTSVSQSAGWTYNATALAAPGGAGRPDGEGGYAEPWAFSDFSLNTAFVNANCEVEIKQYTNIVTLLTWVNVVLSGTFASISSSYTNTIRVRADAIVDMDLDADGEETAKDKEQMLLDANASLLNQISRFIMFKFAVIVCYAAAIALRYTLIELAGSERGVDGASFYFFFCGADRNYRWQMDGFTLRYRCIFSLSHLSRTLTTLITFVRAVLAVTIAYSIYKLYRYRSEADWLKYNREEVSFGRAAGLAGVFDAIGLGSHARDRNRRDRDRDYDRDRDRDRDRDGGSSHHRERSHTRHRRSQDIRKRRSHAMYASNELASADGSFSHDRTLRTFTPEPNNEWGAELARDLALLPAFLASADASYTNNLSHSNEESFPGPSHNITRIVTRLLQHPQVSDILHTVVQTGVRNLASDSSVTSGSPEIASALHTLATDPVASATLRETLQAVMRQHHQAAASAAAADAYTPPSSTASIRERALRQTQHLPLLNVAALREHNDRSNSASAKLYLVKSHANLNHRGNSRDTSWTPDSSSSANNDDDNDDTDDDAASGSASASASASVSTSVFATASASTTRNHSTTSVPLPRIIPSSPNPSLPHTSPPHTLPRSISTRPALSNAGAASYDSGLNSDLDPESALSDDDDDSNNALFSPPKANNNSYFIDE